MTLEYDGTRYAGWQRQLNSFTLQQAVEEALCKRLDEPIRVVASGRTDSGVHAMGQVISFPTQSTLSAIAIGKGLYKHLPKDIAVISTTDAPPGFDARRSALLRWYRFFLLNRPAMPAIGANYLTHVHGALDFDLMQRAAQMLSGEHDFSSFRATSCTANRTQLSMYPIELTPRPDNIIQLDFKCRSFLHNLVRILTGTIIAAGRNRICLDDIENMLNGGQRPIRIVTAKPNGLFLYRVFYKDDLP